MRFEELPHPPTLPDSYVMIAFYGGTSNFPMGTFCVLSAWWDLFKDDAEIIITRPPRPKMEVLT